MPDHDAEPDPLTGEQEAAIARERGAPLLEALVDRQPGADARAEVAAQLARAIVTALGMRTAESDPIVEAARLQEVGKIYVDADLLARPLRELDESEREALAEHHEHGRALAHGAGIPRRICSWILHARERWDGSGPGGLTGEEIPVGSRIIAITREYVDAPLWSDSAGSPEEAQVAGVSRLRDQAGAQLDPELAELAAVLAGPERTR